MARFTEGYNMKGEKIRGYKGLYPGKKRHYKNNKHNNKNTHTYPNYIQKVAWSPGQYVAVGPRRPDRP